jgi:hypothetical protein
MLAGAARGVNLIRAALGLLTEDGFGGAPGCGRRAAGRRRLARKGMETGTMT